MAGVADSKVGRLVRHALGAALSPIRAGEEKISSNKSGTSGHAALHLTSDAFADGAPIPIKYASGGENISPALAWSGVPDRTRELVLIVEDPDAPMTNPFVHWILHRLSPTIRNLPMGVPTTIELPSLQGAVQGQNDMKKRGWYGPEPPLGHGVHHYHFQLFALDTQLSVGADATVKELVAAMKGHVLAEGEIVGTYERKAT